MSLDSPDSLFLFSVSTPIYIRIEYSRFHSDSDGGFDCQILKKYLEGEWG